MLSVSPISKYLLAFVLFCPDSDSRAYAQIGSNSNNEIDAAMTCAAKPTSLTLRCSIKVVHRPTNAPICVHRGSINFTIQSPPNTETDHLAIQPIELKTDTNGEMKDLEVSLNAPGIWSVTIKAGNEVILKSIDVRIGSIRML